MKRGILVEQPPPKLSTKISEIQKFVGSKPKPSTNNSEVRKFVGSKSDLCLAFHPQQSQKPRRAPASHHHEVPENGIRQIQDHRPFDETAEDAEYIVHDSDHWEPGEYVY